MKVSRLLGTLLAACLTLGGGVASASLAESGPAGQPDTEGPVSFTDSACSDDVVRSDSGEVLGTTEACVFLYQFDSLSEVDVLREYGAAWLQAEFTPAEGWCATEVGSSLELTGGEAEGVSKDSEEGKKTLTKLTLTAGGNALENARISQTHVRGPGESETTATTGGPNVGTKWEGKSSKPVSIVNGVAYSYEFLQGDPGKINYGFTNFSLEACAPVGPSSRVGR